MAELTKIKVVEITPKTSKSGDSYWQIKDVDGTVYNAKPWELAAKFQVGKAYTVGINSKEFKGKEYHWIQTLVEEDKALAQSAGVAATNHASQETNLGMAKAASLLWAAVLTKGINTTMEEAKSYIDFALEHIASIQNGTSTETETVEEESDGIPF